MKVFFGNECILLAVKARERIADSVQIRSQQSGLEGRRRLFGLLPDALSLRFPKKASGAGNSLGEPLSPDVFICGKLPGSEKRKRKVHGEKDANRRQPFGDGADLEAPYPLLGADDPDPYGQLPL